MKNLFNFEAESFGPEYIRWVQRCLNRIRGLRLPVNGVMGIETRSAVRNFQKQRGLPVDGLVGPPTQRALIAACGMRPPQTGGAENMDEEIGPISAALLWLPDWRNPQTYTRAQAMLTDGGGVYIPVDQNNRPLKVGQTSSFRTRFNSSDYRTMERNYPGLRFYLARIRRGRIGTLGIAGVNTMIERAIARTLYRAKEPLPEHTDPFTTQTVEGSVNIANILPRPLIDRMRRAYTATGTDPRGQAIRTYPAIPPRRMSLILEPAQHPEWEHKAPRALTGPIRQRRARPFDEQDYAMHFKYR